MPSSKEKAKDLSGCRWGLLAKYNEYRIKECGDSLYDHIKIETLDMRSSPYSTSEQYYDFLSPCERAVILELFFEKALKREKEREAKKKSLEEQQLNTPRTFSLPSESVFADSKQSSLSAQKQSAQPTIQQSNQHSFFTPSRQQSLFLSSPEPSSPPADSFFQQQFTNFFNLNSVPPKLKQKDRRDQNQPLESNQKKDQPPACSPMAKPSSPPPPYPGSPRA